MPSPSSTPPRQPTKGPIAHLRGRPFTFAQIKPTKINLSLFGGLLAVAVLGDDEVNVGLKGVQICRAFFVGRACAVVVRRHLEHRLDVGLGLKRNVRRHPLHSD